MANLEINITGRRRGNAIEEVRRDIGHLINELRQLDGATRALAGEMAAAIIKFRQTQSESIALKAEFRRLKFDGNATEEMFRSLSQRIDAAQIAEREAIEETRRLSAEFIKAGGSTAHWDADLRMLTEQLDRAQGYIDGVSIAAKRQEATFRDVGQQTAQTTEEVKQLNRTTETVAQTMDEVAQSAKRQETALDRLGDEASQTNAELRTIGQTSEKTAASLKEVDQSSRRAADSLEKIHKQGPAMIAFGNVMGQVLEDAIFEVWRFSKESVEAFYEADRGIRQVTTLIPGATAEMRGRIQEDARLLSMDLGRVSSEVLPAVYQVLNMGRGEENIISDITLASTAARAGVADLSDTLKVGVSVMNAYGQETYSLERIYDLLFYGVKHGQFTLEELAGGFAEVNSVAAESQTPLEDIIAALIVMTKQGDSFNEAVELSSMLLMQLGTEGTAAASAFIDATGISYREFIQRGGTLNEALQLMQTHADNTGQSLGAMIAGDSKFFRDSQAARAAMELTGRHLETLTDYAEGARETFGDMGEAAAVMGEAAEMNALKASAGFTILKEMTGQYIMEEMRIIGIPLTDRFITLNDALEGTIEVMRRATGTYNTEVRQMLETQIAAAESSEDLAGIMGRIREAYDGDPWNVAGTHDTLKEAAREANIALMAQFATFEEYSAWLWKQDEEVRRNADTWQLYSDRAWDASRAVYELNTTMVTTPIEQYAAGVKESTETLGENIVTQKNAADAAAELAAALQAEAIALGQQWQAADQLISGWVAAQREGREAIIAANQDIRQSYEDAFLDAILKNEGLTEATLATVVAAGLLSQEQADMRWQVATTTRQIERLIEVNGWSELSAQEQATAYKMLTDGYATTAEAAVRLAENGFRPLTGAMADNLPVADGVIAQLDMLHNMEIAPSYTPPPLEETKEATEDVTAALHDAAMALAGHYSTAQGLVEQWVDAQTKGQQAIIAANTAISESYADTFTKALLQVNGLTEATLATMVAAGLLTQQEADLQWQISVTTLEIERLTEVSDWNKLTAEGQAAAYLALTEGQAATAEAAVALATTVESNLKPVMDDTKTATDGVISSLEVLGGIVVNPVFNAPDFSGAISGAQHLIDLMNQINGGAPLPGSGPPGGGMPGDGGWITPNANGTPYWKGGLTLVGEEGPEILNLPRGAEIISNPQTRQLLDNRQFNMGGTSVVINNYGNASGAGALMGAMERSQQNLYNAMRL